jgi:hypothetical protein
VPALCMHSGARAGRPYRCRCAHKHRWDPLSLRSPPASLLALGPTLTSSWKTILPVLDLAANWACVHEPLTGSFNNVLACLVDLPLLPTNWLERRVRSRPRAQDALGARRARRKPFFFQLRYPVDAPVPRAPALYKVAQALHQARRFHAARAQRPAGETGRA